MPYVNDANGDGFAALFRQAFASVDVNSDFTEATIALGDGSRLRFCHRVGQRWVRAVQEKAASVTLANEVLAGIAGFRLNAKHLEIEFADGSRWELRFS